MTARRRASPAGTGGAGPGGRAPGDGALEARPDSGPVASVMGGPELVDLVSLMGVPDPVHVPSVMGAPDPVDLVPGWRRELADTCPTLAQRRCSPRPRGTTAGYIEPWSADP